MNTTQESKFKNVTTDHALFGSLVANYRERAGLKQHELSKKMGLNPATWSRIEKGETSLSAFQLHSLSKILSISMDKMFADFDNFSETLPRQGIDVLSNDKYKKIVSGVASTATTAAGAGAGAGAVSLATGIAGAAAFGVLPVVGPLLAAVVGGLLTGQCLKEKASGNDEE